MRYPSRIVPSVLAILLIASHPQDADPERPPGAEPPPAGDDRFAGGAFLEEDREISRHLARARQHREAGEWVDAVRILQEILERPEDPVVTDDGRLYRPVSAACRRIIANLPPEGLEAYRRTFDAEAARLFEDARAARDPEALMDVGLRYFGSSVGVDALEMAGDLHLDRRAYARALRAWDAIRLERPGATGRDRVHLLLKMAHAASRTGRRGLAEEWLDEALRIAGGNAIRVGGRDLGPAAIRETLLLGRARSEAPDPRSWPMAGGDAAHTRTGVPIPEDAAIEFDWAVEFDRLGGTRPVRDRDRHPPEGADAAPLHLPPVVADEEIVVTRAGEVLIGVELETGRRTWDYDLHEGRVRQDRARSTPVARGPRAGPAQGPVRHPATAAITIADGLLFVVEGGDPAEGDARAVQLQRIIIAGGGTAPIGGALDLVAYRLETGEEAWRTRLDGFSFATAPTPAEGRLFVPLEKEGELHAAAFDPAGGKPIWRRFICGRSGTGPVQVGVPAAVHGGLVHVLGSAGVVAAMDAVDGRLAWISRYEQAEAPLSGARRFVRVQGRQSRTRMEEGLTWLPSPPLVAGGRLIVAPADSGFLFCFEDRTGDLIWRQPKDRRCSHLIGAAGGRVVAGGKGAIAYDIETGKVAWETPGTMEVSGRGAIAGGSVYLPAGGRILEFDLAGGRNRREVQVILGPGGRGRTGDLVVLEGRVLAAHPDGVDCFVPRRVAEEDGDPPSPDEGKAAGAAAGPDVEGAGADGESRKRGEKAREERRWR